MTQRPSVPWFWILLPVLVLLLPGPARRLVLDLVGGITLTLLLLPLLAGGLGLIAWQILRRRLRTCESCGFSSLGSEVCPACGTAFRDASTGEGQGDSRHPDPRAFWADRSDQNIDARNVTINVDAVDVESTDGDAPAP